MKIKSNVRAGAGGGNANSNSKSAAGGHSSQAAGTIFYYLPPISRCVGI